MQRAHFSIPDEFKGQLEYVAPLDKRSDDEIMETLTNFTPIKSEKNIWAYWHSGVTKMPDWCRRNVISWVRLCGPSWTVRVLDTVENSPNHVLKFVPDNVLPDTFVQGTMDGPYVGPHSADFLRGACLYLHGGVYMDVGNILIRSIDRICWAKLEDPNSPWQVSVPWMYGYIMANHFVASRKGDPFIKRWHDLFVYLWQNRTNHDGIATNPLLSFGLQIDFTESQRRGFHWNFDVDAFTVFQYITQVMCWARLCLLDKMEDGINTADYAKDHILWFDSLEENWATETVVGFLGSDALDAFSTSLDANPDSNEYKLAYKLVWRLLTGSSLQKISHGKNLMLSPALGLLWDSKENADQDMKPGTFAELLRYGILHFTQTRKEIRYVDYHKPAEAMNKGLLEA